jgi:hypothetical protein
LLYVKIKPNGQEFHKILLRQPELNFRQLIYDIVYKGLEFS